MSRFILILFCSFTCLSIFARVPEQAKTTTTKAPEINAICVDALRQLDELKSIVDYLWLAINKGAIKVENPEEVRGWKQRQEKAIRTLQGYYEPSKQLSESQLYTIVAGTKLLTAHLHQAVENELNDLEDFEVPLTTRSAGYLATTRSLRRIVLENNQAIRALKEASHNAGLTVINRFARKADEFNEKYGITRFLTGPLPVSVVLGATAIWLAPEYSRRVLEYVPGGSKLSNLIGNRYDRETREQREARETRERQGVGLYTQAVEFLELNSYGHSILKILGGVAAYAMTQDLSSVPAIGPMVRGVKSRAGSYWQKAKGFSAPEKAEYSIIEHLTLDDERLVGAEEQVAELRNLVEYITNPEIYDRSNSNLEKGILIVGPTRNGKTHLAEATAGSINQALKRKGSRTRIGFKELKWGDVKWSSEGIKTIIAQAKQNAPCILFIDEIHNLPLQTKEGGETLTEFLVGMSGVNTENDAKHQVILLAATNQPDKLDEALLQPGRFGTIISVEKPNYAKRKKYFEVMFKHDAVDTTDIDIDALARLTQGCSYGKLASIIKSARFNARKLAQGVSQVHFQEQIDRLAYRFKKNTALAPEEKHIVSVHQAGHALMYHLLKPRKQLEFVTLRGKQPKILERRYWEPNLSPKERAEREKSKIGAVVTYNPAEALQLESGQDKEKLCKIKMAGYLAEQILLGSAGHNYHPQDRQKARQLVKSIVLKGDKESDLSKPKLQSLVIEAEALFDKYEQEAYTILKAYENALKTIAEKLEQKATLYARDIAQCVSAQNQAVGPAAA